MKWLKSRLAGLIYGDSLSIVPASLRASWPQRMFLKRILRELDIDCILDVGANIGQYGGELRRIGYTGRIISFEPDPQCYAKLLLRCKDDPNWEALNLALGSQPGQAEFNIMAVSLFNSFRAPSASETNRFSGANEVVETVKVEVARLSDILPDLRRRYGFRNVFLKMDTQGFDSEVFAGASDVHSEIRGLQSEIGVKRLYEGVRRWPDQIEAYAGAGFDLAGIYAVNPDDGELIEFDCYFRRSC